MTGGTEFEAPRAAQVAGGIVVAMGFLYLHTFGGSVMAELAAVIVGDDQAWRYRGLSTLLALGGVLGAVGAAMKFRLEEWQRNLSWSLRACSIATVWAVMAGNWVVLLGASFAVGTAMGWLLTTLATGMRASVGTRRMVGVIGAGLLLAVILGEAVVLVASWFGDPIKGGGIVVAMLMAATSVLSPFLTPYEPSMAMERGYHGRGLVGLWLLLTGCAAGAAMLAAQFGSVISVVTGLVVGWASFYFAARSGRVWVVAGTVVLVYFLAPLAGSWFAG